MAARFEQADKCVDESKNDENLALLEAMGAPKDEDAELLWRLARAKYLVSENAADQEKAKQLATEAHALAERAVKADAGHYQTHKWLAIALGRMGDFVDTKTKIQSSYAIGEHARKAAELNPQDATVQHLLGRWCFSIANISFIERNIASVLFAAPPTSTNEEALAHFLKHEELLKGGGLIRNKIFIGDTYLKLNNKDKAAEYFKLAMESKPKTPVDEKYVKEAADKYKSASSKGWW